MYVFIYVYMYLFIFLLYVDGSMNDNCWALHFGGGALCCLPNLPSLTATQGLRGFIDKGK